MRVAGGPGRFDGRIDYNAELFEAATIRRMAGHFPILLRGMLENPEKRISVLPLLTVSEREQLLEDWNRPAAAGPSVPRKFLHEAFESQVAQTPEAIAIISGSERLTYRELDAEANKFANYLRERHVGADVLVGISLERSPELVIALLGILKAGGAYVPLEPSYPPAQLKALVEQVQPALIVTQQRFLRNHTCSRIATLLLDSEQAAIAASASVSPGVRVTGDNLATVIFSSGSTGMPKAIAQRHAAMAHDPRSGAPFEIRASDRHVLKTTLDSTLLVRETFWPLLTGGTMVIAGAGKTADVAPLLKVLREERITLITLVPSLLRLLVDAGGLEACTGLRHVACFGEPLPADLEERFCDTLSAGLWSYYGTTEAPTLALRRCDRGGVRPLGNLGFRIPSKKVYVLDANLEPAPIGVPGELYAGGSNLAIGYLNQPATADARFVRNPFVDDPAARMYRTGDRVRWREDGSLEFIGRVDDQLKIRGYRVEPAEVEATRVAQCGRTRRGGRGQAEHSRRERARRLFRGHAAGTDDRGSAQLRGESPPRTRSAVDFRPDGRTAPPAERQVGPKGTSGSGARSPRDERGTHPAADTRRNSVGRDLARCSGCGLRWSQRQLLRARRALDACRANGRKDRACLWPAPCAQRVLARGRHHRRASGVARDQRKFGLGQSAGSNQARGQQTLSLRRSHDRRQRLSLLRAGSCPSSRATGDRSPGPRHRRQRIAAPEDRGHRDGLHSCHAGEAASRTFLHRRLFERRCRGVRDRTATGDRRRGRRPARIARRFRAACKGQTNPVAGDDEQDPASETATASGEGLSRIPAPFRARPPASLDQGWRSSAMGALVVSCPTPPRSRTGHHGA